MTHPGSPHRKSQSALHFLQAAFVVWIGSLMGCELISTTQHAARSEFKLPPLVAPKESVQLEIVFIDRPTQDALIGDSLWKELDQIASMPSDQRALLRRNGWRIGHSGSRPPRALAELLNQASEKTVTVDPRRRSIARRVDVLTGTDAPIEVTDPQPSIDLRLENLSEPRSYENGKCVVRVRCERESDGWVTLHFQPEIHHGATVVRPIATQLDWIRRRSPEVDPLYDQQFSLSLNVGETVVLTAGETESSTVGDAFFRSLDPAGRMQRLLVIRVSDMQKLTPIAVTR